MPFFMQLAFLMVGVAIVKAIDRVDYTDALYTAAFMIVIQLGLGVWGEIMRRRAVRAHHAMIEEGLRQAMKAQSQSAEKQP